MKIDLRSSILCGLISGTVGCATGPTPTPHAASLPSNLPAGYAGKPYSDSRHGGGPQAIPGRIMFAYFDIGGEGVAYHDTTPKNLGSGMLNPVDGSYLNQFRMDEAVDASYTKFHDEIDHNPYNIVQPPDGLLYVGWTDPGEWFNLTVNVAEAGTYSADILYTSNRGGEIAFELNAKPLTGPIKIKSTANPAEPIAWRQWHHWNVMQDAIEVQLPRGTSVLTVHIVSEGNMNLATMEFKRKR